MNTVAAAVVGAILCATVAAAQTPKPAPRGGDEIKTEQRRLQETQRQLNEERAKAAAAAKRETSLLAELETIDKSLLEKKGEVTRLDARVNKAEAELGALRGDIGRLAGRRSEQQEQLMRRLRALYKVQAEGGAVPVLLGDEDPMRRATALRAQVRHQRALSRGGLDPRRVAGRGPVEDPRGPLNRGGDPHPRPQVRHAGAAVGPEDRGGG